MKGLSLLGLRELQILIQKIIKGKEEKKKKKGRKKGKMLVRAGNRTHDPKIRSPMLYQVSYWWSLRMES